MKRYLFLSSIFLALLTSCRTTTAPTPKITPTPFIGNARAELGDITMYFEVHGTGEPLLLLHGGFGSAAVWSNQVPVFSQQYRVITPDSRGQGRTTDSEAPLSYHQMAEDMLQLMDYLQISSAYVVGWSDGGIIGIDLAIHHPERVKALVVYGATISPEGNQPAFIEQFQKTTVSDLEQWLGREYIAAMADPEHLPVILEKIKTMWLTEPNFTTEELASLSAPTLVMDGQLEDVVRPEHAQVIADAIPNSQLLMLPNTGHYAVLDMPATWNKAVLDFLQGK